MRIESKPVPLSDPALCRLRSLYFQSLYEPQDFYSESLSRKAIAWLLFEDGEVPGYFLLSAADSMLLEFFVTDERRARDAFDFLLMSHRVSHATCKTSDALLLSLCLANAVQVRMIAFLFSSHDVGRFREKHTVKVRTVQSADIGAIQSINDGFFDSDDEIGTYVRSANLLLYEEDGDLLGIGLIQPVVCGLPYRDLGMLVNPSRRREGIGKYIVTHLLALCVSRGLRPICCCDAQNIASRACLEAAGFRGKHCVAEFSLEKAGSSRMPPAGDLT